MAPGVPAVCLHRHPQREWQFRTIRTRELFEWFLVGAKSEGVVKVQPKSAWTLDIITQAHMAGKRVWMKDNLSLIQEDPHDPA